MSAPNTPPHVPQEPAGLPGVHASVGARHADPARGIEAAVVLRLTSGVVQCDYAMNPAEAPQLGKDIADGLAAAAAQVLGRPAPLATPDGAGQIRVPRPFLPPFTAN
jgi:hypothetical protein